MYYHVLSRTRQPSSIPIVYTLLSSVELSLSVPVPACPFPLFFLHSFKNPTRRAVFFVGFSQFYCLRRATHGNNSGLQLVYCTSVSRSCCIKRVPAFASVSLSFRSTRWKQRVCEHSAERYVHTPPAGGAPKYHTDHPVSSVIER